MGIYFLQTQKMEKNYLNNEDIDNIRKKMIAIAKEQWATDEELSDINNLFENEWI